MNDISRTDLEAAAAAGNGWAQQELIKNYRSVHDAIITKRYDDNEMLYEAYQAKPTVQTFNIAKTSVEDQDENHESEATILRHDKGHDDWHKSHGDEPCTSEADCKAKAAKYEEAEKSLDSEFVQSLKAAIRRGGDMGVRAQEVLMKYSDDEARDENGRFAGGGGGGGGGNSEDGGKASGLGDKARDKSERADEATERSTQKPGGVSEKTAASAHAAAARASAAAAKAYDDIGDKKAAADHAGDARYHAESAIEHRGNMEYVGASADHINSADKSVASAQKAAESVAHLDPYQ